MSSAERIRVIAGQELRRMAGSKRDVGFIFVFPLVVVLLTKAVLRAALAVEGFPFATGLEQAVPGCAVLFSSATAAMVGLGFALERAWGTWDRVRLLASPVEIVVGKVVPQLAIGMTQQVLIFGVGVALGLELRHVAAIALVALCLVLFWLAAGMAMAVALRSEQIEVFGFLFPLMMTFIAGSLVPLAFTPGWARAIAPLSPPYWAMRAHRSLLLLGDDAAAVALPVLVLLAWTVVLLAATVLLLNRERGRVAREDVVAQVAS
jgi:ABC-2 type transport system permease protein